MNNMYGSDEEASEEKERRQRAARFLDIHVFQGLGNRNTGFDVSTIKYFDEVDFAIVLERVRAFELGVHGIEPWKNGEYYVVATPDREADNPRVPAWYETAFARFRKESGDLLYSASYDIPDELIPPGSASQP